MRVPAVPEHSELIAELPDVERMQNVDRISLAKSRRAAQLAATRERERTLPPPRERRPRLRFSSEIELLDATSRADSTEVLRLLQSGADPNSHNEDGLTPLHQCAIDENVPIMEMLIRHGADVNAKDTEQWTPLHAAACCKNINVVRVLMNNGADLLAMNADGNMPYDICDDDATLDAIENEMAAQGITQAFIDEQRGASEKRMLDDMKQLHQQGRLTERQSDGSTYLHAAATAGYYDVAAFLLRCGVDAKVRDNDLWTPLHAAACWSQPDLIELLVDYGGDVNATTSNGETAFDLAEDPQTRAIIATMQQQEARKKRGAFGVRDSRRASRRRKKFESPQQVPTGAQAENPFSARGAIRRQSLRDRPGGLSPARIDAKQEGTEIMRSWSKEDLASPGPSTSDGRGGIVAMGMGGVVHAHTTASQLTQREISPSKRLLKTGQRPKPMSPDEWLRKLERGEEEEEEGRGRKTNGKSKGGGEAFALRDVRNGGTSPLSSRRDKKGCCCVIC